MFFLLEASYSGPCIPLNCGASVNPNKIGLVAFTRNRESPGFFEPRLFGKNLHRSMLVKYLGVILDSRLTWKEHVDVKVKKAQNSMWACRRACGVTWGLKRRVVHWLYIAVIRPSVTFASLVWWPGSDSQCQGETKQGSKISLLRDNRSYAHYSHQCCGSTHLPTTTGVGGSERG